MKLQKKLGHKFHNCIKQGPISENVYAYGSQLIFSKMLKWQNYKMAMSTVESHHFTIAGEQKIARISGTSK